MSQDLVAATAANRTTITIAAAGRTEAFPVGPIKTRTVGRLQAWLNARPHPHHTREAAEIAKGLDPGVQKELIAEARNQDRSWPPSLAFTTEAALYTFLTIEGGPEELLTRILEDARPDLSEACVRGFVAAADQAQFTAAVETALSLRKTVGLEKTEASLLVAGPDGIRLLARAVAAILGVDADEERLAACGDAIVGQMALFGTVIPLAVAEGQVQAPKGEMKAGGGRSGRSTSPRPTPS